MRRIPTGPDEGRKYQSAKGRFYIGWGGSIYALHLEIGRCGFTVEASAERQANRRARSRARLAELKARRDAHRLTEKERYGVAYNVDPDTIGQ